MDVETDVTSGSGERIAAAPPPMGEGSQLAYNSPLSKERVAGWVDRISTSQARTVVDAGCGWGTLLIDIVAATPRIHGTGIDVHGPDVRRGQREAARRNVADRVTLIEGDAAEHMIDADVVINIGAYDAFGTIPEALRVLHDRVAPGGLVIFGAEYWEQPPTEEQLDAMWPGTTLDDCTDLPGMVDHAVRAGFRPLRVETATPSEWEEFECGQSAAREEWLVSHPNHPDVPSMARELDEARSIWLRGHRNVMGLAYLTLLPVITSETGRARGPQ